MHQTTEMTGVCHNFSKTLFNQTLAKYYENYFDVRLAYELTSNYTRNNRKVEDDVM